MKRTSEPIELHVKMTLKKPFPINKNSLVINKRVKNIILSIEDDYPEIHVNNMSIAFRVSDTIDCEFTIDPKFAKKNMYYNGKFNPERYMGAYLSRVARRMLKMSDQKWLARYFWEPGMFAYEYSVM